MATPITKEQVLEAIRAEKGHFLNYDHIEITDVVQKADSPKHWVVHVRTSWGTFTYPTIRIEVEYGQLEIW